jgi:hypothetical protein
MADERPKDPQEEQLGRKPSQKQASIDVFEHSPPPDVAANETDEPLPPEVFPNEAGFVAADEEQLTTDRSEDELPPLNRDYPEKNEERSPEARPPVPPERLT